MRLYLALALVAAGCATDTSAEEARRLVARGARLLDVRSRAEFAERHLDGSINIPVEELQKRVAEVGAKDKPVIVYCHTGVRSGFAVQMLRKAGFTSVHNLGSIGHWSVRSTQPPPPLY
jgi:rhodanese-related sulfurtransferase